MSSIRLLLLFVLAAMIGQANAMDWIVTDTGDAGDGTCDASCTLRDAVGNAGASDRILFDLALPAPVEVTLTGPAISITIPLRIIGNDGVETRVIRNGTSGRMLELSGNADVRIVGVGFQGALPVLMSGNTFGGAIFADTGTALEIRDAVFRNNLAGGVDFTGTGTYIGAGGAIYTKGQLIIDRCAFVNNTAAGSSPFPAPVSASTAGGNGLGGAIYAEGDAVSILNTTFSGNTAAGGTGGSPAPLDPMSPGINGGNGGNGRGGALYFGAGAVATVGFSTFIDNQATAGGGGSGSIGTPPGNDGLPGTAEAQAIDNEADALLDSSVLAANGAGGACTGTTMTVRSGNLVDEASCPGTLVSGLDAQFEAIDTAAVDPHYTPLPDSDAVNGLPDCLDPTGVDIVNLDQLLSTRPAALPAPTLCDFGAVELNVGIFSDGFEIPPPPL